MLPRWYVLLPVQGVGQRYVVAETDGAALQYDPMLARGHHLLAPAQGVDRAVIYVLTVLVCASLIALFGLAAVGLTVVIPRLTQRRK